MGDELRKWWRLAQVVRVAQLMTGNQNCGDSHKLLQAAQLATEGASGDEYLVLF